MSPGSGAGGETDHGEGGRGRGGGEAVTISIIRHIELLFICRIVSKEGS